MGTIERTVRPLTEKELRLLAWALAWRKRRQNSLRRRMFFNGLLVFGVFSGLIYLSTLTDRRGPAWYYCLLIGLVIAALTSIWPYFGLRRECRREVNLYERVLHRNEARVVRIQSDAMVEFEEQEDEGACYAFQLDSGRVVFLSGQDFYPSARFPNSDFSIVNVHADDGRVIASLIEKNGVKLKPLKKISLSWQLRTRIPENFETIDGDLSGIEEVLSQREQPRSSD